MTVEEQTDLLLKGRDDDNNINVGEGGSSDPLRPHFIFKLLFCKWVVSSNSLREML